MKKIKKALISVSNKKNLSFILKILKKYNIQLISSGGTYKEIKELGFNCIEISKYTGSKEILGGRVKTLNRFKPILRISKRIKIKQRKYYNEF